jgi:hypothetical protein
MSIFKGTKVLKAATLACGGVLHIQYNGEYRNPKQAGKSLGKFLG